MINPSPSQTPTGRNFEEVLAEYLQAAELGETPNQQAFLIRHPELANELQEFFENQAYFEKAAGLISPYQPALPAQGDSVPSQEETTDLADSRPLPSLSALLTPGACFGDYELLEELGHGGMGIVYKARQIPPDRLVALKVVRRDQLDTLSTEERQKWLERFRHEAQWGATLDHPHIIPVFQVGEHAGQPFFSMKLVEGGSLRQWIKELHGQTEAEKAGLPAKTQRRIAGMLVEIARAVHHAHQRGILHRDLKPGNILIDAEEQPLVADFGLAKRLQPDASQASTAGLLGTLPYMAPEQASPRKKTATTTATDIYGLGTVFYEMLTGRPPFRGQNHAETLFLILEGLPQPPREMQPSIDRDLEIICLKCLQKDPQQRYPSAEALAEDLENWLDGRPIQARPVSRRERLWRWCRRNPAIASLSAAVVCLLLAIAGISSAAALWLSDERNKLQDLNVELADQVQKTGAARQLAESAEEEKTKQLWQALFHEAQALRWSGKMGQRFKGLNALWEAAKIKPSLELRNEAIACMTLTDLRVVNQLETTPPRTQVLAFDASVRRYAWADENGNISIRWLEDNHEELSLPGSGPAPECRGAFSPDGRFLAVQYCRHPGELSLWNLKRREPILKMSISRAGFPVAFDPDSSLFAVGKPDGSIDVYELASQGSVKRLSGAARPHRLCFHPDGQKLAVASLGKDVVVWDLPTEKVVETIPFPAGVYGISWHPDGKLLAAGCVDHRVYVWNLQIGQEQAALVGHQGVVTDVLFNHAGDVLMSTGWDGATRLWDPWSGQHLVSAPGHALSFSPDDRFLGFAMRGPKDGWNLWVSKVTANQEFRMLHEPPAPGHGPGHLDISPDGRYMASCGDDGVRLWDVTRMKPIAHFLGVVGRSSPTHSVIFHPDGNSLITSSGLGLCRWPIDFDREEAVLRLGPPQYLWDEGPTRRARLSRYGRKLVVVGHQHTYVIDLAGNTKPIPLKDRSNTTRIAVSPDGKWVAAGRSQHRISVWNAQTGEVVADLPAETYFGRPTFSPDEKWLVTSTPGKCRFWEVGSWKPCHDVPRDEAATGDGGRVAFTRDGRLMAYDFSRRTIVLVEPRTGKQLAALEAPDLQPLSWLCFTPDGSKLVAATNNHRIQFWDLRNIRTHLKKLKLDWNMPPFPPVQKTLPPAEQVRVQIDLGTLAYAEELKQAKRAYKAKQWEQVVGLASSILSKDPKNTEARRLRADAYYRDKEYSEAVSDFSDLLKELPEDVAVYHYRAHCYEHLKSYDKAVADFTEAIRLDNTNAHFYRCRGDNHYRLKNFAACIKDWETSLQLRADQPALPHSLAYVYLFGPPEVRNYKRALPLARQAAERQPQSYFAQHQLGVAYYRNGQFAKAAPLLEKGAILHKKGGTVHNRFYRAMCYWQMGNKEKARSCYEEAVKEWDRSAGVPKKMSSLYLLRTEAEALLHGEEASKNQ